jgi:hypothetical protein
MKPKNGGNSFYLVDVCFDFNCLRVGGCIFCATVQKGNARKSRRKASSEKSNDLK